MPWKFEGENKNPFRLAMSPRELALPLAEGKNLSPKQYRFTMSPLETMLAAAVMTEAMQRVNIFLAQLPKTEANFEFEDFITRANQGVKREVNLTDEDTSSEKKFSSHLTNMKTLMFMIKDELLTDEEPAALYFYNDLHYWLSWQEKDLITTHAFLSDRVVSTKTQMQEAEEMSKRCIIGLDSGISTAEAECEEAYSITTIMKEYATKYQTARSSQNSLKIQMAEKLHKKELYNKLKAIDDENRANKLITKYVDLSIKELEKKTGYWSKKYDQDVEEIDLKIATGNQEIPELVNSLAEYLTLYYRRELELAQYVRLRNWRLKVEDIGCFLEFFTVFIQAWWRGTMVRWEIGPYSPKKMRRRHQTLASFR